MASLRERTVPEHLAPREEKTSPTKLDFYNPASMYVLFDHPNPFVLAHGGFQVQIQQTFRGVSEAGVQVDWLHWWDDQQKPDVIHYFGRPPLPYLDLAHRKGIRVVLAELLTGTGSRSPSALAAQRLLVRTGRGVLPWVISARFGWDSFRISDACIANTPWEAHIMRYVFGADPRRVHIVANGVEEVFLNSKPVPRGIWLVCSATITPRKRVLELAQAAVHAGTPLWVLGKPYGDRDPYAETFIALAKANPKLLRYEGAISDRARLASVYREARGFVLLSTMETRSLASEEAAGCGCPLLLSDLPWARSVYGEHARYCRITPSIEETAASLKQFYDAAPTIPAPPRPATWGDIGRQLRALYEGLLSTSR